MLQSQTHWAGGFEQHRPAVQSGGQKSPCGAFLDARLAISTRAHQKDQRRKYAGLCFIRYLKFHSRGWIRTAAATSLKTAQKQPSGLFLAARLATPTRAHQKIAPRNVCFWVLFFCYNPLSNPLFQKTIQKATEKMSFCITFMLSPPRCTAFPETAPRWAHRSAGSLPAAAHRQGL